MHWPTEVLRIARGLSCERTQGGFANADLDAQLAQRGVEKIFLVGMVANTCIEGTARFGMELGYHVTLIKDTTAAFR